MLKTEGIIATLRMTAQAGVLMALVSRPRRGLRAGHAWEGSPGTWEIPMPPRRESRNRRAERKRAKRRQWEVGAPQYER